MNQEQHKPSQKFFTNGYLQQNTILLTVQEIFFKKSLKHRHIFS